MEKKFEYIDALRSITSKDVLNYVSFRYIDMFGFEVKRTWNAKINNVTKYQGISMTPRELLIMDMIELYNAKQMISLEVRYTNKHGYPCSILKFE